MTRIEKICTHIPFSEVFIDVGCDHGYCTEYVLKRNLCRRAYLGDVSEKCLDKARSLLKDEIADGRCFSVCTDGLKGFPERADCVLIAGMGGEEIVRILSEAYIPEKFVLQPMKNSEKLRAFLLEKGCRIEKDFTFADGGKYYDLIVGENAGGDAYSEAELIFGRDNLRSLSGDFLSKLKEERAKLQVVLKRDLSAESRAEVLVRLRRMEEIIDEIKGNF